MNLANLENEQLKDTLKQAIRELIQEDKALFSDLITEAIEDVALVNAIKEEENSPSVSRDEVFMLF
jgi:hypothetical protein